MTVSQTDCQNGRKRAKSAKMAGYSKSCAKPQNICVLFFLFDIQG
jgi:hypothetical protein